MTKTNLVFLSGVGRVGKTTVLEEIKRLVPEVQVMPSITRTVYAKMGLTEERQAMGLTSEQRNEFQTLIFETYIEETTKFIQSHRDLGPVLIDRSPFDHVSYKTYIMPEMTLVEHEQLVLRAQDFMHSRMCENSHTVIFPFPVPWADSRDTDPMRYAPVGKNLAWHHLLAHLIEHRSMVNHSWLKGQSIKSRAIEILSLFSL